MAEIAYLGGGWIGEFCNLNATLPGTACGVVLALKAAMTAPRRQDLCERALRFSIGITVLHRRAENLSAATRHAVLQLYRSGTAVGALLEEGQVANSRRDMAAKYAIALREAREAQYWSRLLAEEPLLSQDAAAIAREAGEFVAMLTVSVRKLRQHPG